MADQSKCVLRLTLPIKKNDVQYSLNLITRKEFKTGTILSVDVTYTKVEWAKFDWKVSCILYVKSDFDFEQNFALVLNVSRSRSSYIASRWVAMRRTALRGLQQAFSNSSQASRTDTRCSRCQIEGLSKANHESES